MVAESMVAESMVAESMVAGLTHTGRLPVAALVVP
jgi:hypothetical protein